MDKYREAEQTRGEWKRRAWRAQQRDDETKRRGGGKKERSKKQKRDRPAAERDRAARLRASSPAKGEIAEK